MKVLKGEDDLSDIEECYIIRKQVFASKQPKDLATLHVLKREIDMCIVLKTFVPSKIKKEISLKITLEKPKNKTEIIILSTKLCIVIFNWLFEDSIDL